MSAAIVGLVLRWKVEKRPAHPMGTPLVSSTSHGRSGFHPAHCSPQDISALEHPAIHFLVPSKLLTNQTAEDCPPNTVVFRRVRTREFSLKIQRKEEKGCTDESANRHPIFSRTRVFIVHSSYWCAGVHLALARQRIALLLSLGAFVGDIQRPTCFKFI